MFTFVPNDKLRASESIRTDFAFLIFPSCPVILFALFINSALCAHNRHHGEPTILRRFFVALLLPVLRRQDRSSPAASCLFRISRKRQNEKKKKKRIKKKFHCVKLETRCAMEWSFEFFKFPPPPVTSRMRGRTRAFPRRCNVSVSPAGWAR